MSRSTISSLMLDPKFCVDQVGRLSGLGGFPNVRAGQQELVKALQTADTEAMALAIVNDWIKAEMFSPRPVDLYALIRAERERQPAIVVQHEEPFRSSNYCKHCQGFGFYGGHIGTNHDGPWTVCGYCASGASPEARRKVDEGNDARNRLLKRFGPKSIRQMVGSVPSSLPPEDGYHGDI